MTHEGGTQLGYQKRESRRTEHTTSNRCHDNDRSLHCSKDVNRIHVVIFYLSNEN